MVKFLHAADLHLDSPFSALKPEQAALRRREQRLLLSALAQAAKENACQLMLLAGDLFDSADAYPETVEALMSALADCGAQVFIAPGNHDCCLAGSACLRRDWPENVRIFTSETVEAVELPELGVRVYGAGFRSAQCRPLLPGFRAKQDGMTNLMVLHGDVTNAASPYNAVSPADIAASGLSYLALGHIHMASGLQKAGQTFYAWPGCAVGRGFDELGQKGCYLGTLEDSGGVQLEFLPLGGRKYEILNVPAGQDALASVLDALSADTSQDIYRIVLTGEADTPDLAALREALEPRFYALQLRDATTPRRELWAGMEEDTLRGLFLRRLHARYEAAQEEPERRAIALAARLGLAAMEGREEPEV